MVQANNNTYNSTKELKILNFYSDWCPPCHAFMPNFIGTELKKIMIALIWKEPEKQETKKKLKIY